MKLTTINVEISRRTGNYETTKIGAEWSISESESESESELFNKAVAIVEKTYHDNYLSQSSAPIVTPPQQPQPAPQPQKPAPAPAPAPVAKAAEQPVKKKVLTLQSPELSAVTKRIADGVSVEEVLKYYDVDNKMLAVLKLAEGSAARTKQ